MEINLTLNFVDGGAGGMLENNETSLSAYIKGPESSIFDCICRVFSTGSGTLDGAMVGGIQNQNSYLIGLREEIEEEEDC